MMHRHRLFVYAAIVAVCCGAAFAQGERKGATIYVSKLGDNSDGSSWAKAFHTIQAAVLAVPDNQGGHTIVIRPDTYVEANLYSEHKGAKGAYNLIMGDFDGKYGSGGTGWVILDSGCPDVVVRTDSAAGGGNPPFKILDTGGPEPGLKSIDWWGPIRCDPKFSAIGWDRWIFRRIYACGSEGGIGWDLTCEKGAEFSAIQEDCFGIGRFAGTCVGAFVGRQDEPVTFRRCWFWSLDWWGDACGAYVRAENTTMPAYPDVVFEDCTLVGPDNALQAGNPGFDGYSHVRMKDCRLISLNFSQPQGKPGTGIIYSTIDGKFLQVDLEDCFLMGFKVFGAGAGDIAFTTKGSVKAYLQFTQSAPEGFEKVGLWPTEVFNTILPAPQQARGCNPLSGPGALIKLPVYYGESTMESTPVLYKGRPMLVTCTREASTTPDPKKMYLFILDLNTAKEVTRFGEAHSFASAFVNGDELNVWAAAYSASDWTQDIYCFSSTDLKEWKRDLAIAREGDEHLFNSSVCRDDQGFLMAYESNKPVAFCFKFARSKDLTAWEKIPGLVFTGTGGEYSACPVVRYFAPYYYVIYLHAAIPGHNGWVSFLARSKDLVTWDLSPRNPILEAGEGEGSNNSDVDLFEWQGNTYIYYATGDQATWGKIGCALYQGPMRAFFESYFPEGKSGLIVTTRK